MLRYLGSGERDYALRPVAGHHRDRWEFQAVVSGLCAPTFQGRSEQLRERSLWLFPPESLHGWTGRKGRSCRVSVFHFEAVPDPLGSYAREQEGLRVDLTPVELAAVEALNGSLENEVRRPDALSPLRFQQALLQLSLLVASHVDARWLDRHNDRARHTVYTSLAWFDEHMGDAAGVDEMAVSVGVSASHLRRLFHQVEGKSPNGVIRARRLERARLLLRTTGMSVEEVARATGYQTLASFSRAFKTGMGVAPQYWRRLGVGPLLGRRDPAD